jgi:SAM-dependent methyltransferase
MLSSSVIDMKAFVPAKDPAISKAFYTDLGFTINWSNDEIAEKKARKAGAEVVFRTGLAESLPFPDAQFDVVLSTVMLHHLPLKARQQCAKEIRRVLKPSGRVLAVDFEGFSDQKRSLLSHFRRPHGHVSARDLIALLSEAGLTVIESGAVGIRDLQFILATWLPLLPLKKAER